MRIGVATEFGQCKGVRRDGRYHDPRRTILSDAHPHPSQTPPDQFLRLCARKCSSWLNASRGEYCEFHAAAALRTLNKVRLAPK